MQMQMQETWLKQVPKVAGDAGYEMRVSDVVRRDVGQARWEAYDSTRWGWDVDAKKSAVTLGD